MFRYLQKALPYLQRERELVSPLRDDAVSLKLIIGYCLAGEHIPASAYDSLDSGVAFSDHSTTVSTLRWLTSVIATNRCESWVNANLMMDILQRKSASLSGPGILSHNWELHLYIGQLLSYWKHDLLAYPHFKKAYQYAPDSKVQEIRALMGSPPS